MMRGLPGAHGPDEEHAPVSRTYRAWLLTTRAIQGTLARPMAITTFNRVLPKTAIKPTARIRLERIPAYRQQAMMTSSSHPRIYPEISSTGSPNQAHRG